MRLFALGKTTKQTHKERLPWTWEKPQQDVFDTLKAHIIAELVLIQPRLDQPFELEVNSLGFAQGAVLVQRVEDGKQHPVGFYSKTLTEPK